MSICEPVFPSCQQVSEDYVYKLLKNIDSNKSTGLDELPAKFIKDSADIIKNPVTYIVNLSISTAQVPKELKLARVIPLHKKQSTLEASNYRPVSILCILSKVLERTMCDQFENYLRSKGLLYKYQSGFRPMYSTDSHDRYYKKRN